MTNGLLVHFASGQAFFSGIALILLAARLGLSDRKRVSLLASLSALVGIIFIYVSATPLPLWFMIPAGCFVIYWRVVFRRKNLSDKQKKKLSWAVAAVCAGGVAIELPWHFVPEIPPLGNSQTLTIFGDSVTAGTGNERFTWPKLLAERHSFSILDYSSAGATTATALKLAKESDVPPGIVLIELGGNDLLGSGNATEFRKNLDELLSLLAKPDRTLVMLELPLPPTFQQFGKIQRSLAKQYEVRLVPKRLFLSVLLSDETTLDSIHLSPEGHRQMALLVESLLTD